MFWTECFSSFCSIRNIFHFLYLTLSAPDVLTDMTMFSCACFALTIWVLTHHWHFSSTVLQLTCDFTSLLTLLAVFGILRDPEMEGRPGHKSCCGEMEEYTETLLGALWQSNVLRNPQGIFLFCELVDLNWTDGISSFTSEFSKSTFQMWTSKLFFSSNKQRSRQPLEWDPASEDFLTEIF